MQNSKDASQLIVARRTELTWRQVGRVLDATQDTAERERAAEWLLPLLWSHTGWVRYRALCLLTTRIYLPYGLHALEWASFPAQFRRALNSSDRIRPAAIPACREAVARALRRMLETWRLHYIGGQSVNYDVGADACEAAGRMNIHEAEPELLSLLQVVGGVQVMGGSVVSASSVRLAALTALATLPPERLDLTWRQMQKPSPGWNALLASLVIYMRNPAAVPFLLDALPRQAESDPHSLGMAMVKTLGFLGDPRALPALQALARQEGHPLRPVARTAIKRLMKEAQGMEEVTLVRASDIASRDPALLLRPAREEAQSRAEELLRPVFESDPSASQGGEPRGAAPRLSRMEPMADPQEEQA